MEIPRTDQAEVRTVDADWAVHADAAARHDQAGERSKWQAAEEYRAAHEAGASWRQIAERAGCSHVHARRMAKALTWVNSGEPFHEAYSRAKKAEVVGVRNVVEHSGGTTAELEPVTTEEELDALLTGPPTPKPKPVVVEVPDLEDPPDKLDRQAAFGRAVGRLRKQFADNAQYLQRFRLSEEYAVMFAALGAWFHADAQRRDGAAAFEAATTWPPEKWLEEVLPLFDEAHP